MSQEPCGRLSYYRDLRGSKRYGARKPLCSLNISLPHCEKVLNHKQLSAKVDEKQVQLSICYYHRNPREHWALQIIFTLKTVLSL